MTEEGKEGYFFYTDCYGKEKAGEIRETAEVVGEDEFRSGGWVVRRIHFRTGQGEL